MTEDDIKEALSRQFLRILAEGHGFKVTEPPVDHGVDMVVCQVTRRVEPNGKTRYLDSQYKLDFQLKSTTANGIIDDADNIKYDLEVKNYNDLVHRREDALPLHLLVVVLNDNPPRCIHLDDARIGVIGNAYWYLPPEGAEPTQNQNTIRITIPKTNRVGIAFVRERFEELGIEV